MGDRLARYEIERFPENLEGALGELNTGAVAGSKYVKADGVTDDTEGLIAAIDDAAHDASTGRLVLPPGRMVLSGEIEIPRWRDRRFVIDCLGTEIVWNNDLGADKFGFKPSLTVGDSQGYVLRNCRLDGPGDPDWEPGFSDTDMSAILVDSSVVFDNVHVGRGFRNGIYMIGNHNAFYNCKFSGFYSVYRGDAPDDYTLTNGDNWFVNVDCEAPNQAAYACSPGNSFLGTHWIRGHAFLPPVAFLKEGPDGTDDLFLNSCTFQGWYAENYGNAVILADNTAASIGGLRFYNCDLIRWDGAISADYDANAMIDVPFISDVLIDGGNWQYVGDLSLWKFEQGHDIRIVNQGQAMYNALQDTKPAFTVGTPLERNVIVEWADGYISPFNHYGKSRLYKCSDGVTIGDLVGVWGDHHKAKTWDGSFMKIPSGVAVEDASADDPVLVLEEGRFLTHVHSSVTVTEGSWVKADNAHTGCVENATGPYDTNVVGFACTGTSTDGDVGRSAVIQYTRVSRSTR